MSSPADRRYTKTHEWVSLDGDVATCLLGAVKKVDRAA